MEQAVKDAIDALLQCAELVGSRGMARFYGRPEPEGADYDWVIFADDPTEVRTVTHLLELICRRGSIFTLHQRLTGVTACSPGQDISVYPTHEKAWFLEFWRMREEGISKEKCSRWIDEKRREWERRRYDRVRTAENPTPEG